MPAWNQKLEKYVKDGKFVVLGIAQEQHPHRNRLFTQWHGINWPVLHDPINLMQVRGVPIEIAIDEHGIVRSTRIKADTLEQEFISKTFAPEGTGLSKPDKTPRPDLSALQSHAKQTDSAHAWRALGDALVLWEGITHIGDAIEAYAQAIRIKPDDGDAYFRLGVCYRMRYESDQSKPTDFQMAVDHWTKARHINPNQYIWRRRVEQYGPRQTKPYPFYDWVDTASREIKARDENPIALKTLPTGSELAQPNRSFKTNADTTSPDPEGRVFRDTQNMILAEVTVIPPHAKPGDIVRVHVSLRPNSLHKAHWNNEAEPLRLWIDPPDGFEVQPQLLTAAQGDQPETEEPRRLEFEVRVTTETSGPVKLNAYALYYVCEDMGGTCTYLRQDIPVRLTVDER